MTKYDIGIMVNIWENLTSKQKRDALQQAKNNICSPPNGMTVETWNVCTHFFKEKGLARAAHIEGGGVEAIQLTDLGISLFDAIKQTQENTQSLTPEPQQMELKDLLPKELKSEEAVKVFQKAIEAQLIIHSPEGLKWNDTKQLLAYFATKVSEKFSLTTRLDKDGNITTSWKPLESLFNEQGLKGAKQNWMRLNTKFEPTGLKKVDACFRASTHPTHPTTPI